jgi:hypothetical protein
MNSEQLRHSDVWYGEHEGFYFEIRFRETLFFGEIANIMGKDKEEQWTYYVTFLPKNMPTDMWDRLAAMEVTDLNAAFAFDRLSDAPKEGRNERWSCDYYNSMLATIFWHEGITFCEFIRDAKGTIEGVKAGCDYSHYHDEDCTYSLEYVMHECISTICSFIELTQTPILSASVEAQTAEMSQLENKENV